MGSDGPGGSKPIHQFSYGLSENVDWRHIVVLTSICDGSQRNLHCARISHLMCLRQRFVVLSPASSRRWPLPPVLVFFSCFYTLPPFSATPCHPPCSGLVLSLPDLSLHTTLRSHRRYFPLVILLQFIPTSRLAESTVDTFYSTTAVGSPRFLLSTRIHDHLPPPPRIVSPSRGSIRWYI